MKLLGISKLGNPVVILLIGIFISGCSTRPPFAKWSEFKKPKIGASEVIGKVESGCVIGAEELQESENLFVMRKSRHRYFGHPDLIHFVDNWAKKYREETGRKVCVGDLAQPRGGPFYPISNHRSHQTGIDADLWFEDFTDAISQQNTFNFDLAQNLAESETDLTEMISSPDVRPLFVFNEKAPTSAITTVSRSVAQDSIELQSNDSNEIRSRIIKSIFLAATDPKVERLFVNPVIKNYLCKQLPLMERLWIRKVRPWWGHEDHMHVRLRCPLNNHDCVEQTPIPEGDGCDETLDWWFTPEATTTTDEPVTQNSKSVANFQLPERCDKSAADSPEKTD